MLCGLSRESGVLFRPPLEQKEGEEERREAEQRQAPPLPLRLLARLNYVCRVAAHKMVLYNMATALYMYNSSINGWVRWCLTLRDIIS